jgi:hypothetical protein
MEQSLLTTLTLQKRYLSAFGKSPDKACLFQRKAEYNLGLDLRGSNWLVSSSATK